MPNTCSHSDPHEQQDHILAMAQSQQRNSNALECYSLDDQLQVVHPNMYSVEDDHFFCSKLPAALKLVDDITQQGKAALPHMEALVIYLARDDSLEVLGPHLILPLIQQRLDGMQADAVCLNGVCVALRFTRLCMTGCKRVSCI